MERNRDVLETCRGRNFLLLGRCWEGLAPTGGDGDEEDGWALADPGVLRFFGLSMLTFTGCTPELLMFIFPPVLQHGVLHPAALGHAPMASCCSFPSGCSWLQSSSLAGWPGLAYPA